MCRDDDTPQQRSILARLVDKRPRTSTAVSLASWIAAIAVLLLHANRIGIHSDTAFVLADSWLIGIGSVGVPMLVFHLLGRFLTPRALELIAAVCFTGAVVVTLFVGTGQSQLSTWTACFLLILFLALGIQSLNAAYGLDRRRTIAATVRAEAAAESEATQEAAYLAGIIATHEKQRENAEAIGRLLDAPTEELEAVCGELERELVSRRGRRSQGTARILRMVTDRTQQAAGSEND